MRKIAGWVGVSVGALALVPAESAAQAIDPPRYGYGPWMMDWSGGWFGMMFGPIFMILVLAGVIAAVVILVRGFGGPAYGPNRSSHTSIDILKERYARGEIDKAEYEERRKVLAD